MFFYFKEFALSGHVLVCLTHTSKNKVFKNHYTYRNFAPGCVKPGGTMSFPRYEPQADNLKRVVAWLNHTGKLIKFL